MHRLASALAAIVAHPGEAFAILGARLTGKRVRARQALASLVGLDHSGLGRVRLTAAAARSQAAAKPRSAPTGDAPTIAVVSAGALPAALAGNADILVLVAPGHSLIDAVLGHLAGAFAAGSEVQAVYGDALVLSGSGADRDKAMPLLRPAFDPDYLLAVDYIGPVVALRRTGLVTLGFAVSDLVASCPAAALPPETVALDAVLRLADRFGRSAIRHLPRYLSLWEPRTAGEGGLTTRAARLQIVRQHLERIGEFGAGVAIDGNGVLIVEHPLPDPSPLVTVIVPTRDRLDLLKPCLDSLRHATDWPACEILICDNDSREPATHEYFRALAREGTARVIACPGPFDFAAMNNAAAGQARGRLLAFVNNDVVAFQPDWLRRMVREALRPDVGAVGAKLLDAEGRIQHAGVVLGAGGLVSHGHRFFAGDALGYLSGLQATREVSAVTAACLVVEAGKFASVGGFDAEAFAIDFNDVDLCLRLNRAGYRTLLVASAVLHHNEAASRRWNSAALERHGREVAAFRRRWGPLLAQDPHYHPGFDPDLGTYSKRRPEWPATLR